MIKDKSPASQPAKRRVGMVVAALALLSTLSGCVIYPAFGPEPERHSHYRYWHDGR